MRTDQDMRFEVEQALNGSEGEYDVAAIVDEVHQRYGLIAIDDVPEELFWDIVRRHEL